MFNTICYDFSTLSLVSQDTLAREIMELQSKINSGREERAIKTYTQAEKESAKCWNGGLYRVNVVLDLGTSQVQSWLKASPHWGPLNILWRM